MRVANSPSKPLLLFDGDCNFCRRWIARWQQATGDAVDYRPAQDTGVAEQFPEVSPETFRESVVPIEPDGEIYRGAEAVLRTRSHGTGICGLWWAYQRVPGIAPVVEWFYKLVARNRQVFSWLTRFFWGA